MAGTALGSIPGGQALIEWFGRVPNFHDAELLEIRLASNDSSTLRIRAFRITDKVDDRGYFILDKHVVVTFTLEGVAYVALNHFNLPGIIFNLEVAATERGLELVWTGSYGVEGTLRAERLRIDFVRDAP